MALFAPSRCICEDPGATIDSACARALASAEHGHSRPGDLILRGPLDQDTIELGERLAGDLYLCDLAAVPTSSVVRFQGLRTLDGDLYIELGATPMHLVFPDLVSLRSLSHRIVRGGSPPEASLGTHRLAFPAYVGGQASRASFTVRDAALDLPATERVWTLEFTGPASALRAPRLATAERVLLSGTAQRPEPGPVGLPRLQSASVLLVDSWPLAAELEFERLETLEELHIGRTGQLRRLGFPRLRVISSRLRVREALYLGPCDVQALLDQLETAPPSIETDLALDAARCP